MESNFRKALKEVMGVDKEKEQKEEVKLSEAVETKNEETTQKINQTESNSAVEMKLESVKDTESKANKYSNQNSFAQPTTGAETAIITKATKVEGSLNTDSNIVIAGEMIGDVTSTNSVSTTGRILGGVTCKNFEGNNAKIEGDIKVENILIIKNNCDILGDISAKRIELSGRVKGNIVQSGEVFIAKEAYIIGNVTASTISIEKGAIIQGLIKIKTD